MVSNSVQEYKDRLRCPGICGGSDDYKYDFLTSNQNTQNNHEDPFLSREDEQKKQEMEALLSDALNQLSFDERQRQQEAIHGVIEKEIIEDEALICTSLQELDSHLMSRNKTGRSAYETAERMDPQYTGASTLRLMFLRCNHYDAKASARQMVQFFEVKQELFGVEKLVKEITILDLDANDLASLNCGYFRIIGKDQATRDIFLGIPSLRSFKKLKNELRAHFYFKMSLLKQEEIQLKGIVGISYEVGRCGDRTGGVGLLETRKVSNAIPLRKVSAHLCIDNIKTFLVYDLVLKATPAKLRSRLKIHYGSHLECQYRLASYGIPKSLIPLDVNNNAVTQDHLIPIPLRRTVAAAARAEPKEPIEPIDHASTDNNVLFIAGRTSNSRGNHRLRTLVAESSRLYTSGSTESKRGVVDGIIGKIHAAGGLFLKPSIAPGLHSGSWIEIPIGQVRTRISQMFRNKKRSEMQRNVIDNLGAISDNPLPDDVVFERSHQSHGKVLMKHLIKDRFEEYESLDRSKKMTVVNVIIDTIKGNGGRFLQTTSGNGGYVEVPNEKVRELISKYFRNHRRTSVDK